MSGMEAIQDDAIALTWAGPAARLDGLEGAEACPEFTKRCATGRIHHTDTIVRVGIPKRGAARACLHRPSTTKRSGDPTAKAHPLVDACPYPGST